MAKTRNNLIPISLNKQLKILLFADDEGLISNTKENRSKATDKLLQKPKIILS